MDQVQLDSLDSEKNDESTYRVGIPYPQTVENEGDFMTNSARKLRNYKSAMLAQQMLQKEEINTDEQQHQSDVRSNPPSQGKFEMTDSIKAQLHLSLDRLSETSFDAGANDVAKVKTKAYPALPQSSLAPTVSHSPSLTLVQARASYDAQQQTTMPEPAERSGATNYRTALSVVRESSLTARDSLATDGDDVDEDDVPAAPLRDSIEEKPALQAIAMSDKSRVNQQIGCKIDEDPYAHLRYDPGWREADVEKSKSAASQRAGHEETARSHDTRYSPKTTSPHQLVDDPSSFRPPGGAITIHRPISTPPQDSPVRLSADPQKLLAMNAAYEQAFNKMLEKEKQSDEGAFMPQDPFQVQNTRGGSYVDLQNHVIAPPAEPTYYESPRHRHQFEFSPRHETVHSETGEPKSVHSTPGKATAARRLDSKPPFPTPPRAPKTARDVDYIEMNKMRLGRKSNSASYLEMYAKRVKQQNGQERRKLPGDDKQPRSRTDTDSVQNLEPSMRTLRSHSDVQKENTDGVGLEDKWKLQAERLRAIKERKTKSKAPARQTLREVLNTSGRTTMPSVKPEEVVSSNQRSSGLTTSPRRRGLYVDDDDSSDFSDHPAFAAFSRHPDERNLPHHPPRLPVHPLQQVPNHAFHPDSDGFDSSGFSSSFRSSGSDDRSDGWGGYRPDRGHAEPNRLPQYFYVDPREAAGQRFAQSQHGPQSFHSSPMMQAYQHRYGWDRITGYNQVPLPPNPPANPLSPREHSVTQRPFDFEHPIRRQDVSSDSTLSSIGRTSSKKRVNFDPSVFGQTSSRIPVPSGPHAAYRYPVPLPPAPSAEGNVLRPAHRAESGSLDNPSSFYQRGGGWFPAVTGSGTITQQHPSVPVLPPILGAKKDRDGAKNYSSAPESSRLSDDDGDVGYLERHKQKKKKPGYKRYTLEDYKNLKKDHLNVGGLGPDLVAAKEKTLKKFVHPVERVCVPEGVHVPHWRTTAPEQERPNFPQRARFDHMKAAAGQHSLPPTFFKMGKVERARKYAEFIRQQHMSGVSSRRNTSDDEAPTGGEQYVSDAEKLRFVVGADSEEKRREKQEKRKRAIEYARNVPKPKAPPTELSSLKAASQSSVAHHHQDEDDDQEASPDWELMQLQALRERHEREKAMVAHLSSSVRM